ncbi:hypothetical protein PRBEI_2000093900 [Prionailurus iriomotensis]
MKPSGTSSIIGLEEEDVFSSAQSLRVTKRIPLDAKSTPNPEHL